MSKRILYITVIICAILTGLSFGLGYGTSNDLQYLIEGLRLVDPNFLEYDWFASQTTHYHHNFSYIVYALSLFGSGPWNLAILNLCLTTLGIFFVFKWVQTVTSKHILPTFLLIMCLVMLFRTRDVADSGLFGNVLQPSSFAGACLLGAISFFISGHFAVSGVFLAIGGWFHTNFLLLGFPLFFCGHLALGKNAIVKRLLQQLGPSVIIFAITMPVLIEMALSENGAEARRIFLTIRSPSHYVPRGFLGAFIPYVGWHILALVSMTEVEMEKPSGKRLSVMYLTLLGLVILATLLTTVVFIPFISQLFFWRLAPISTLLAQTMIVLAGVQQLTHPSERPFFSRRVWGKSAGIILGFCVMVFGTYMPGSIRGQQLGYYWDKTSLILLFGMTLMYVWFYWLKQSHHVVRLHRQLPLIWAVIPFVFISLAVIRVAYWNSTVLTLEAARQEEMELYYWTRTTPKQAIFVIPPGLVYFRFHGERAVVVDWFSTPMAPDQVLEWYRRIGRICGNMNVKSLPEAEQKYAAMDQPRLNAIIKDFGTNYAVFRKAGFQTDTFSTTPIVFSNAQFVVLQLD